jgi:hypothetical protein
MLVPALTTIRSRNGKYFKEIKGRGDIVFLAIGGFEGRGGGRTLLPVEKH